MYVCKIGFSNSIFRSINKIVHQTRGITNSVASKVISICLVNLIRFNHLYKNTYWNFQNKFKKNVILQNINTNKYTVVLTGIRKTLL